MEVDIFIPYVVGCLSRDFEGTSSEPVLNLFVLFGRKVSKTGILVSVFLSVKDVAIVLQSHAKIRSKALEIFSLKKLIL